jgi:hypothetical protein
MCRLASARRGAPRRAQVAASGGHRYPHRPAMHGMRPTLGHRRPWACTWPPERVASEGVAGLRLAHRRTRPDLGGPPGVETPGVARPVAARRTREGVREPAGVESMGAARCVPRGSADTRGDLGIVVDGTKRRQRPTRHLLHRGYRAFGPRAGSGDCTVGGGPGARSRHSRCTLRADRPARRGLGRRSARCPVVGVAADRRRPTGLPAP